MASRRRYTGVVAGGEEVRTQHAAFELLWLRDIVDADGLPFQGVPYLMIGAQVRRLGLRPGEAITFVAQVAALAAEPSPKGDGGGGNGWPGPRNWRVRRAAAGQAPRSPASGRTGRDCPDWT